MINYSVNHNKTNTTGFVNCGGHSTILVLSGCILEANYYMKTTRLYKMKPLITRKQ